MRTLYKFPSLLACLFSLMFLAGMSQGQEDAGFIIEPFFGLAVAYPDSIESFVVERQPKNNPGRKPVGAILTVNKKGKISQVEFADDSANYFKPIEKRIKKIRLNFVDGLAIGFPQRIPITVRYRLKGRGQFEGQLSFPIDHKLKVDTLLLTQYFQLNNIVPAQVEYLRPVFHKPLKDTSVSSYPIIRVVVRMDKQGRMTDLIYPDGEIGDHYLHLALMDAEYQPLIISGVAVATDLPLIFRMFDNLKYPFSPTDRSTDTADTTDIVDSDSIPPKPITASHFMKLDYNRTDLSLPPLPRKHPFNYINSAPLGRRLTGAFSIKIGIDSTGWVTSISIPRASSEEREIVQKAIKLIRWYPALDSDGLPIRFFGQISLHFDRSPQIVYNAEWLSP